MLLERFCESDGVVLQKLVWQGEGKKERLGLDIFMMENLVAQHSLKFDLTMPWKKTRCLGKTTSLALSFLTPV